jgi:hypothetical protein
MNSTHTHTHLWLWLWLWLWCIQCTIVLFTNQRLWLCNKQVKLQCKILIVSLIVPLMTIIFGFNFGAGALGIVFYIGFMIFSLTAKGVETAVKGHDLEVGMVVTTKAHCTLRICSYTKLACSITVGVRDWLIDLLASP